MGAMAGITFRSGRSVQFFIVASTLSLTLVFTANYFFLKYGRQYDMLKKSRENVVAMVKASEATESEREILLGKVEESFRIVKDIIPFSYFLNSLIFSAFGFWVMRAFFERFSGAAFRGGGIEFFQLKDYFVFALIAGWLVVLLVDKNGYGPLHAAGLNLALIMTVLYLIQSLGIIKHFMLKKGWPTYLVPAVLVLFLLLGVEFFMFFLIILSGVGIIDFWADFRKLGVRTGKEE